MKWTLLVLPMALTIHACQPPPRSASWFEAHPEDAARVLAACANRSKSGPECADAREGQAAKKRGARKTLYRQAFE